MPSELFDALKLLVDGAALVVAVAAFAYAHFQARRRATHEQLAALADRLGRHAERITAIEGDLRHVPDAKVMHDMAVGIEEMRGSLKAVAVELTGIKEMNGISRRQLEMLDGYLRESKQ